MHAEGEEAHQFFDSIYQYVCCKLPVLATLSAVHLLCPHFGSIILKGMSQSGSWRSTSSYYYGSQPTNRGMGLGPQQSNGQQSWFGLEGGTFMGTDCRIPIWKAELILNFPEGISTGWSWSFEKRFSGTVILCTKSGQYDSSWDNNIVTLMYCQHESADVTQTQKRQSFQNMWA